MRVKTRIKGQWEAVEECDHVTALIATLPKETVRRACHLLAGQLNTVYQKNLCIDDPVVDCKESGGYATIRTQSGKELNIPADVAKEYIDNHSPRPLSAVCQHLASVNEKWLSKGIPKKVRDALK